MDELLRNWLRRYFVDPVGALPLIKEELRSYPPEVARQFHTEKNIIDEYFALVVKDGHCPSEVWLPLHPGLSKAAEAIIKQIESMVLENRKAGRLGRKLGPYRLLYRIGAGGMAEVYAAEKTDVEVKRRALKIIRLAERYQDWPAEARQKLRDDLAKRLLEEVAILEEIHHPRIVRYFDPLTDPASGELCIVTELIEGFSLERLLEEGGSFPPREGLAVATAIGEGLVEVHNKKVIHRDLTPANVLIDRDGNVKIIDFGLAKSVNPSARNFQTGLDGFHWRALRYASPEQLRREEATTKSDVYMLGKLLYVLLLYRPEWEEREEGQAFWPIASREDPVWESLPADFVAFILKATAEDPAARFDDAATMLEELRRLNGNGVPLQDCIRRVRELQDENDPAVNVRIGDWLATQALPPPLPNVPDGIVVEDEKIRNPSRRRVLVASGLAFFALAVVLPLVLLSLPGASRRGNDSKPISFKGECYWRLRARPGVSVPAQGLPLGAPDVDYLKGGDRVVFQAELSEGPEAYFYVLHIDVQGETHLLYPPGWTWTDLPPKEKKRKILRVPEKGGDAPLADSATGLESLLWLARTQPLTTEANNALKQLLTSPALQWQQSKQMLQMSADDDDTIVKPIWMENGVFRVMRGTLLLNEARIAKDPVQQTEKVMLAIRDQQLASYTRAVCYAFLSAKTTKKD